MMKMKRTKLIINDRKFYRQVAAIAIPIALQSLITTGVNMMDTIMIGAVGETELSRFPWRTSSLIYTRYFAWEPVWAPLFWCHVTMG